MLCVCKKNVFLEVSKFAREMGMRCVCMLLTITERSWVKGETIAGCLDIAESCQVCPLLFKKKSAP